MAVTGCVWNVRCEWRCVCEWCVMSVWCIEWCEWCVGVYGVCGVRNDSKVGNSHLQRINAFNMVLLFRFI